MKQGESHIKDIGDFLEKLKRVEEIPKGAILVTADVDGLYSSIPDMMEAWKSFENSTINSRTKSFPLEDIIKMADFVLKNNLFEFDCKFYQQVLGTAIGTKFALPYGCIFMDYLETEFLKTEAIQPWLCKRFIDIFFIWTDSEENLNKFLKDLNDFHPNLKFTYEKSKEKINFLDSVIILTDGKIVTDLYCKPTDSYQYLHYESCHADYFKRSNKF